MLKASSIDDDTGKNSVRNSDIKLVLLFFSHAGPPPEVLKHGKKKAIAKAEEDDEVEKSVCME